MRLLWPITLFHLVIGLLLAFWICASSSAVACPFCTAVGPTLVEERESADVVALAEITGDSTNQTPIQLHQVFKGGSWLPRPEPSAISLKATVVPGQLVLLFGQCDDGEIEWTSRTVNEASAAYYAGAPGKRDKEAERLTYFAPFLEHADATISEDAYREFGHARLESVAEVKEHLPDVKLQNWITSERVPESRKGLYGLALGLASDERARRQNAAFLEKQILAADDDFRAGFDGLLGGYLLLTGTDGLHLLEAQSLKNPASAVGHIRHMMTALRFYHEFGKDIPPEQLQAALANVLDRPEFAEAAIIDLARWQAWQFCDRIAALYKQPRFSSSEIRRAVVGYLLACPVPKAATYLNQLRNYDGDGVAAAEQVLSQMGRTPQ